MTAHGFDPDLYGAVAEVFDRAVDQDTVAAAEQDGLSKALWSKVAGLGFPLVGVDESHGGSGGSVMDALAIAVLAGRHTVPLPVVETHLAAWVLAGSGESVDDAPLTVAPGSVRDQVERDGDTARGVLHDVPSASAAARIVAVRDDHVLSLDPSRCEITSGTDLAGQPREVVRFEGASPLRATVSPHAFRLRGALMRAGQLAGGMDALTEATVRYCGEREQFGRPLHKFQAVQQHLVTLSQSAELSAMAVLRAGLVALDRDASFEICSAKLIANECAADAVRAAHQAHGAISMTREYRVQQLTRRLNAWRWEFGTETDLAREIGSAVARSDSFYDVVAAERESPEVSTCPAP